MKAAGRITKKTYLLGLLLLVPISGLVVFSGVPSSEPEPGSAQGVDGHSRFSIIDAQELKTWLDEGRSFVLVDARPPEEYASGHIPTAVSLHLPRPADAPAREQEADVPVVFYCNTFSGSTYDRCFQASVRHLQNTPNRVYWFREGMQAWRGQGYPVVRSSRKEGLGR